MLSDAAYFNIIRLLNEKKIWFLFYFLLASFSLSLSLTFHFSQLGLVEWAVSLNWELWVVDSWVTPAKDECKAVTGHLMVYEILTSKDVNKDHLSCHIAWNSVEIKAQRICLNKEKAVFPACCLHKGVSLGRLSRRRWSSVCASQWQCTGRCFEHQFLSTQLGSIRLGDSNEG